MPLLKDPAAEARRVAGRTAALRRDQLWKRGTAGVGPAGLRRRGQNPVKTGSESIAFKLAVKYCEAVIEALGYQPIASRAARGTVS